MSRLTWFAAGAAAGVYGVVKAKRTVEVVTPDGVAARWYALTLGARMFTDSVRTESASREAELRERLAAQRASQPLIEGQNPPELPPST